MFTSQDKFSGTAKTHIATQFSLTKILASKIFESAEKILELNISTAKTSLEKSNFAAAQLLSADTPQDFFSLATSQIQQNIEKILSYGREFSAISRGAQVEIIQAATAKIGYLEDKVEQPATAKKTANIIDVSANIVSIKSNSDDIETVKFTPVKPAINSIAKATPIEPEVKKALIAPVAKAATAQPVKEVVIKPTVKAPPSKTNGAAMKSGGGTAASKARPASIAAKPVSEAPAITPGVKSTVKKAAASVKKQSKK